MLIFMSKSRWFSSVHLLSLSSRLVIGKLPLLKFHNMVRHSNVGYALLPTREVLSIPPELLRDSVNVKTCRGTVRGCLSQCYSQLKKHWIAIICIFLFFSTLNATIWGIIIIRTRLPSLYEYYTSGGITEGLKAPSTGFTLNGRPITIYSGALHYFRVHPAYWRDRLRKVRFAGLNAVETYVPWNLHEPRRGEFDFGDGNNDFSIFLDIRRFLQMAQEEDLFVILRPGPYICSEWEFGGLPSWLLRFKNIRVRTSDPTYMLQVQKYFEKLLPDIANLTFSKGGPIIALQIENEYGSIVNTMRNHERDLSYLGFLRELYRSHGIYELFFTSDSPATTGDLGSLPGVLQTANFAAAVVTQLDRLKHFQPNAPIMVMEFWIGWFDHWTQHYHASGITAEQLAASLITIFGYNGSVNFYMFAGGTSFGFMNGANIETTSRIYFPDVSSYDYGAAVTEAGDFSVKYLVIKQLVTLNNKVKTRLPKEPSPTVKTAYFPIVASEYIPILELLEQVPMEDRCKIYRLNMDSSMETLPIEHGNGQSYGIIVYRKKIYFDRSVAQITIKGHPRDLAILLLDGNRYTQAPNGKVSPTLQFGYWWAKDANLTLNNLDTKREYQMDILVENMGRVNFGNEHDFLQKKGLVEGPLLISGVEVTDWDVIAMQFKGAWIRNLTGWQKTALTKKPLSGPAIFRAILTLTSAPNDTFLDMRAWGKGFIFVNGFPLGRYFNLGPQGTNFIPAPLLRQGDNEILIFEEFSPNQHLWFANKSWLGTPYAPPNIPTTPKPLKATTQHYMLLIKTKKPILEEDKNFIGISSVS